MPQRKGAPASPAVNRVPEWGLGLDFDEYQEDDYVGCYECGGRGWIVDCPDDLCHGQDECIHGDPPSPCRVCNFDGEKEDGYL